MNHSVKIKHHGRAISAQQSEYEEAKLQLSCDSN